MAVMKSPNQIQVRPVRRLNRALVIRDVVLTAMVTFFVVVSYTAHLQTVAFVMAEGTIIIFLLWSTLVKVFVGESFIHMIYFNYVREKKWK